MGRRVPPLPVPPRRVGINARPDEEKTPIARIGTNTNTRPDGEAPTERIRPARIGKLRASLVEEFAHIVRAGALSVDDVADVFTIYTVDSAVPVALICRSCHTSNATEAAFCIECGRRLQYIRDDSTPTIQLNTGETTQLEDERNGG